MKSTYLYLSLLGTLLCSGIANAQRIDFNMSGRQPAEGTAPGYTPMTIGRVYNAEFKVAIPLADDAAADAVPDSLYVHLTSAKGLDGNAVRDNYWKQGVVDLGYKLLADGIFNGTLTGNGNEFIYSQEQSGIEVRLSGLSAGEHTLMCFHNFTDNVPNVTKINTYVNGVLSEQGIQQTTRKSSPSEAASTYTHFTVTNPTDTITIEYISQPEEGATYNNMSVAINSMVFDEPNPVTTALDPCPTNQDWHVDADGGSLLFTWKSAANAVKHHLMLGTESGNLAEVAVVTDTCYRVEDLYSLNFYYWRVDEEDANGMITPSEEWSFRPRQLAFADAEGYGKYATGGRGGIVYHVTTLEDSKNPTPGMLRYGITQLSGPRTIVFDISGLIHLVDRMVISNGFVTIAGETAPGNGITICDRPFGGGSESVIRNIRLRLGGAADWDGVSPNENTADGMGLTGSRFSIIDHCSISWTIDESFSSRNAKNITFQNNLISEALTYAGHATQYDRHGYHVNHGYAASIGGEVGSFHHNMLIHCQGRNWSMAAGLDNAGNMGGKLDMFNNVCYNWYDRTTDGGSRYSQYVNNYYIVGPATKMYKLYSLDYELGKPAPGVMDAYVKGNIRENLNGTQSEDKENDTFCYNPQTEGFSPWSNEPFWDSQATIDRAQDALKKNLSNAGCRQPVLDVHDTRMVQETLTRTTSRIGWHSQLPGLIDRETESEGFDGLDMPELSRDADYDVDQDGLPAWYEQLIGTSDNAANNNDDPNHDGWTLLDDYLEVMSNAHLFIQPGATETIDLSQLFIGYTQSPTFSVVAENNYTEAVVNGTSLSLKGISGGITKCVVTVTDAEGATWQKRVYAIVQGERAAIEQIGEDEHMTTTVYYSLDGRRIASPAPGQLFVKKVITGKSAN